MNTVETITSAFNKDIISNGLFWRIFRPNTFVDLLMIEANIASSKGINSEIALNIILISLKAIINDKYGTIDSNLDYSVINILVESERAAIMTDVNDILLRSELPENKAKKSVYKDLSYFKVLNNLNINNFTINIFENLIYDYVEYIKTNL